jgi:hypothetical protein
MVKIYNGFFEKELKSRRYAELVSAPHRTFTCAWFTLMHIADFTVAALSVIYLSGGVPKQVRHDRGGFLKALSRPGKVLHL